MTKEVPHLFMPLNSPDEQRSLINTTCYSNGIKVLSMQRSFHFHLEHRFRVPVLVGRLLVGCSTFMENGLKKRDDIKPVKHWWQLELTLYKD